MESMKRREANSSHHHQSKVVFNNPSASSTATTSDESNTSTTKNKQTTKRTTPSLSVGKIATTAKGIEKSPSASDGQVSELNKDANFEYDDNEWDVRGIGELIIDLDADIEKSSLSASTIQSSSSTSNLVSAPEHGVPVTKISGSTEKVNSFLVNTSNIDVEQVIQCSDVSVGAKRPNIVSVDNKVDAKATVLAQEANKKLEVFGSEQVIGGKGYSSESSGSSVINPIDSVNQDICNTTKDPKSKSLIMSSTSSSSSASSVPLGSNSGIGGKSCTKMTMDHQATLDKGLKMKIKRTKPGTKTSEAKHEIVKTDQNGGSVSQSQDDLTNNRKYLTGSGSTSSGSTPGPSNNGNPSTNTQLTSSSNTAVGITTGNTVSTVSIANTNSNNSGASGSVANQSQSVSNHNTINQLGSNQSTSASSQHSLTSTSIASSGGSSMGPVGTGSSNKRNSSGHRREKGSGSSKDKMAIVHGPTSHRTDKGSIDVGVTPNVATNTTNVGSSGAQLSSTKMISCVCSIDSNGPSATPCASPQCVNRTASINNNSSTNNSAKTNTSVSGLDSRGVPVAGNMNNIPSKVSKTISNSGSIDLQSGSGNSSGTTSDNPECGVSAPPTKKLKGEMRGTRDVCVGTSVGTVTEPDCLGPCEPGTSVTLEGIVWHETDGGVLVVNVTWRGKTYVGTLLDCTRHDWAPPRFCDSPTEDLDSRTPKGRGKRGRGAAQTCNDLSNFTETRSSVHSKLRNGGAKGGRNNRVSTGTPSTPGTPPTTSGASSGNPNTAGLTIITPSPNVLSNLNNSVTAGSNSGIRQEKRKLSSDEANSSSNDGQSSSSAGVSSGTITATPAPGTNVVNPVTGLNVQILPKKVKTTSPCAISPILLECPEQFCNKKYKHANGLRYHQSHAHGGGSLTQGANNSGGNPASFGSMDEDSMMIQPESPGTNAGNACGEPPGSEYLASNRSSPSNVTLDKKVSGPGPQIDIDSNDSSINLTTNPAHGGSGGNSSVLRFGQGTREDSDESTDENQKILEGNFSNKHAQKKGRKSPPLEVAMAESGITENPLNVIPNASQSNRSEDVKSPAYSDISDDSTPVAESDPSQKSTKSVEGVQSATVATVSASMKSHPPQSSTNSSEFNASSAASASSQMGPSAGNFGMFPFYSQSQYIDQLTGKPLTANAGISSTHSGQPPPSGPPSQGNLCDYKSSKEQPPALDLMTKSNTNMESGLISSPVKDYHPSNASALAVQQQQQQAKVLSHFYPFNYMTSNFAYNMDPNYVAMLSEENKLKDEAPVPSSNNVKGKELSSPVDSNNKMMPKLTKNEPTQPMKDIKIEGHSGGHIRDMPNPPHSLSQSTYGSPGNFSRIGGPIPPQMSREEELRRYHSLYGDQRRSSSGIKEELSPQHPQQHPLPYGLTQSSTNNQPQSASAQLQQSSNVKSKPSASLQQSNVASMPKSGIKSESSKRDGSSDREKGSTKSSTLPPPQAEGQKPTMETQGPPPPPTSQYYLHATPYINTPYGFDPSHPMYRNLLMSTGPYNHSSSYHHPMPLARYHGPEDLSRNSSNPTKPLDLLQHHHYYNPHKIHELNERALKSPPNNNSGVGGNPSIGGVSGPGNGPLPPSSQQSAVVHSNSNSISGNGVSNNKLNVPSSPSVGNNSSGIVGGGSNSSSTGNSNMPGTGGSGPTVKGEPQLPNISGSGSSSGAGAVPNAPIGVKEEAGNGSNNGRSPPPQRHVHTHHHTHVGLGGYPMYPAAPYGAAAVPVNPFSPTGPTK